MAVDLLDRMRILMAVVMHVADPQVADALFVDSLSTVVSYYSALDVSMGDSGEPGGMDTVVRPTMTRGMV